MVSNPGFQLRREQRRKQVEAEMENMDQAILSPIVKMDKRFEQAIQEVHSNLEQLEKYVFLTAWKMHFRTRSLFESQEK
jgi:hypothetical protein